MKGTWAVLLALLVLPALGCDGTDSTAVVDPQVVDGVWEGQTFLGAVGGSQSDSLIILMTQDFSGTITGSATVKDAATGPRGGDDTGGGRAFDVNGTNLFPDVFLTLRGGVSATGTQELISYRAEFVGQDRLRGRLNGGGFDDVQVDIIRRNTVAR